MLRVEISYRRWTPLPIALIVLGSLAVSAVAQTNKYIRRSDENNNGYLEPDEISDRYRSYYERIAAAGGINMRQANSIARWEYAARKYYQNRNPAEETADRLAKLPGISGFDTNSEEPQVPGFGAAIKYPYNAEDMEDAERLLRRYDDNRDGELDRAEAADTTWSKGNPFDFDFNRDGRVSLLELAQREARERIVDDQSEQRRYSPIHGPASQEVPDLDGVEFRRTRRENESNSSSRYLASSVMQRSDRNRDQKLDLAERVGLGIDEGEADLDFDGDISESELSTWYYRQMQASVNDLTGVLPTWFFERDANGDQQLDMSEFAEQWDAEKVAEFEGFDVNRDGVLTPEELLGSQAIAGGDYSNSKARMLVPNSTLVSEIEVAEDFIIGDLNIRLSITHSIDEQLDAYLTGPDGQRIELFSGVGGSGNNFEDTVFDDEAREHIRRGRPPFAGSYIPEAVEKREVSLSHYRNKNLKGVWQLMIRASRSERFGVFHGWSLQVKPPDEFAATP